MADIHLYGIPNCDTVKKARVWLDAQGREYTFHDYKKEGADQDRLRAWVQAVGWEKLLNRSGTTFRKLPEAEREGIDAGRAVMLMTREPSMIRRPVAEHDGALLVGFSEDGWSAAFS